MSDIGSLGSQLANASNAAQAKANIRPESPPPLTIQNAVAQTLNTPQTAVMQSPTAGNAEWRREANPDSQRGGTQGEGKDTPTREQLDAFLERLNQRLRRHRTHLQFEVVGNAMDWRIRIVDQDTCALVRWISWEETWAFARSLEEVEDRSSTRAPGMGGGLLRVTA
ncbi:MAG: flagellar protein FlaG [Candidatus Competibacteraceae bacterium]|nr:flagellar protein FlaG [Candidatus Competibacteraceae bacterium]MCB1820822.1 flagellar protein FlaG [Candidatus Competibacteraceae bacterium]HRY15576.1 flagellar protein FlaG [Candidatus Competibacteraceae bacterium]